MCLAVPMEVVQIEDELATVEVAGVRRQINVGLLEDVRIGEFVIVHAGYAIEKLDSKEAEETLDLIRQVASFDDADPGKSRA